jgi:hypothetical protein
MNNYDDILNNAPPKMQEAEYSKEEYAAMKKAEREKLYALTDSTAMEVASDGKSFMEFLGVQSRFSRYSAVNALLIFAQNPQATQIGDFEYWKNKGCYVKGETGFSILEPQEYEKDDGTVGISYRVKKVFDISQINDKNFKESQMPVFTERQILSALVSTSPAKVTAADELPDEKGAMTDQKTGEILVRKNMGFSDILRSLAQEIGRYEANSKVKNEVVTPAFVGYCTAYILCQKYGVDTKEFDFETVPDIFTDLNPQEVKKELSSIRDSADSILSRMSKQLEVASKSEKSQDAKNHER